MRKLTLVALLLFITLLSVPLQAEDFQTSLHRWKLRALAYAKIGYGITSLLAGIGAPIMGTYHFIAAEVLETADETVDTWKDTIKGKIQERPRFQAFKNSRLGGHLLALAGKTEQAADLGIDSQIALQRTSGTCYWISPLFFIPLGIAAIRQGYAELKQAAIAS